MTGAGGGSVPGPRCMGWAGGITVDAVDDGAREDGSADDAARPPVVLAEDARRQVLDIAGQVLGRLPAEEVPASLRSIARFTVAKRVRLGGPALAAALESDESFRARVADVVVETSPELVAAVRQGSAPPAAEPADVAAVAYLVRPPGWRQLIEIVGAAAERKRVAAGGAAEQLRAEVAELRSGQRAEVDRRRAAARVAQERADSMARELRDARTELRALRTELAAVTAEVGAARDAATKAERSAEHELRRLRGQLADAERSLETARRTARSTRSAAGTRAALLVDSIAAGATGLRAELDLPANTLRPADAISAEATSAPVGGAPSSVRQLDELLGMPRAHLIVDGYNVTKTGYGALALAAQRARLLTDLAALCAARRELEVTVAFDGAAGPVVAAPTPRGVRVLFSSADEIADVLIGRLVDAEPAGRVVIVVSSDGEVAAHARSRGAQAAASRLLLDRLEQLRR